MYAARVGEVPLAPLLITRLGNAFPIVQVTEILTSKLKSVFAEANGPEMIVPKVNFRFLELIWFFSVLPDLDCISWENH